MKKTYFKVADLKNMAALLDKAVEEKSAVMNLKDGSRMTTTLYILRTGAFAFLNISNSISFEFANDEELDSYISKKFDLYDSDKDMYMNFTGMDEETWEEWNK